MNWKEERIESATRGENPSVMAEMTGGFATIGDVQFLPGYCVLLPKRPVSSLNDLTSKESDDFLHNMRQIGDVLLKVTEAERINYEILGNTDNFLHAHIWPRYDWEGAAKKMPVWLYPSDNWQAAENQYSETKNSALRQAITAELQQLN